MERILTFFASPLLWMLLGAVAALACAGWLVHRRQKAQRQSRLLGTRLRDIGEMAVEEARVTLVHCTREPRRLFGMELPLMREQCIFAIDVVVKAGFNFDEIHVQVDNFRRRITLRLPEMRILSSAVDYGSMQIYDEKTGVFARPKLEWHKESMLELCHEAEAKARVYGILDRARDSARLRLEAFVGQLYDLTACTLLIIPAGGVADDERPSACA
ncbi:MAG: DUF4230 domain-containing protein [Clostridia bacterium]|nr:DUF4230 domain-containing protein [Clostridia bacterium]